MIILSLSGVLQECSLKDVGRPNTQYSANTIAACVLRTLHVSATHERLDFQSHLRLEKHPGTAHY
jgi:hypothetical protein